MAFGIVMNAKFGFCADIRYIYAILNQMAFWEDGIN